MKVKEVGGEKKSRSKISFCLLFLHIYCFRHINTDMFYFLFIVVMVGLAVAEVKKLLQLVYTGNWIFSFHFDLNSFASESVK